MATVELTGRHVALTVATGAALGYGLYAISQLPRWRDEAAEAAKAALQLEALLARPVRVPAAAAAGALPGMGAIDDEHWLAVDERYAEALAEKSFALSAEAWRVATAAGADLRAEEAALELLTLVVDELHEYAPGVVSRSGVAPQCRVRSNVSGLGWGECSCCGDHPLAVASQLAQEDFVLLAHDASAGEWRAIAAAVCRAGTPAGAAAEQLGRSLAQLLGDDTVNDDDLDDDLASVNSSLLRPMAVAAAEVGVAEDSPRKGQLGQLRPAVKLAEILERWEGGVRTTVRLLQVSEVCVLSIL